MNTRTLSNPNSTPPWAGSGRIALTILVGILLAVWFVYIVVWFPGENVPPFKVAMLGVSTAMLAGIFSYLLLGSITAEWTFTDLPVGKGTVKASGGTAMFVIVLFWWYSPVSPSLRHPEPPPTPLIDGVWVAPDGLSLTIRSAGQRVTFEGVVPTPFGPTTIWGEGTLTGNQLEAAYSCANGSSGRLVLMLDSNVRSLQGKATQVTPMFGVEQPLILFKQ